MDNFHIGMDFGKPRATVALASARARRKISEKQGYFLIFSYFD